MAQQYVSGGGKIQCLLLRRFTDFSVNTFIEPHQKVAFICRGGKGYALHWIYK